VTSVLFEVNHSRDFGSSCDMDATSEKRTTIIHVGGHFVLGSTAQSRNCL